MKEPEAPCLFCSERHLGCHTECDKYKKFIYARKAYRESITRQKIEENEITDIEIKRYRK